MVTEMPFHNRKHELQFLTEKFQNMKNGELIVIYGRRRLGKTRLIKKFIETTKPRLSIYFYINLEEKQEVLAKLAHDVKKQTNDEIQPKSWSDFFEYLQKKAENRKTIICIDEFQRFQTISPAFATELQNFWDSKLKNNPLFLILSGSSVGMMRKLTISGAGPLYGRRTGQVLLKPFAYADFRQAFPKLNEEQSIRWFSVFGGTPFYVEQSKKHEDLWQAVEQEILRTESILREEPKNVLEAELRTITRYNSILDLIASGKQTLKEISDATGIKQQNLPVYMKTLEKNLGLISFKQPLFGQKNLGRYKISDPFFSFWYRFILPNSTDLELGKIKEVLARIKQDIRELEGKAFEKIITELLTAYNGLDFKGLKLHFTQIGGWWNRQGEEIDIVLDNKDCLVLAEVKYRNKETDSDVLENLMRKSRLIDNGGLRKFILVSKSGFTPACQKLAEQTNTQLLALSDIERLFDEITPKT